MCEFVSWIEANADGVTALLYLTSKDLRSATGRKLRGRMGDDVNGHGAIREFYDLSPNYGVDRECDDFSSPDNFPAEITDAIMSGKFRGFGNPQGLLCDPADAEYIKVCDPACAKYKKVRDLADAKYKKVRDLADAEYKKVRDPAYAEYNKVRDLADAKYKKVRDLAEAEYGKVRNPAYVEYNKVRDLAYFEYIKVRDPAYAEYGKVRDRKFWDLFANTKNRAEAWK